MLSQEYFVFKQHSFGVYCVNLTPKYLPFLCLCYQSPCALLLTGGICNCDVIVVCILARIYIFLELETMSFIKLAALQFFSKYPAMGVTFYRYMHCHDFAMIFAIFTKVCRVFCHFCRDFLLSLVIISNLGTLVLFWRYGNFNVKTGSLH